MNQRTVVKDSSNGDSWDSIVDISEENDLVEEKASNLQSAYSREIEYDGSTFQAYGFKVSDIITLTEEVNRHTSLPEYKDASHNICSYVIDGEYSYDDDGEKVLGNAFVRSCGSIT